MSVFQIKQPSSRQGACQNMTMVANTSQQIGSVFGSETFQIMVVVSATGANILIGNGTLTAATTNTLIPPGIPVYFTVTPGQSLAAISTGTPVVSVTELS